MKNIEIIKLILKEKPDEDVYILFNNDDCYNLIYLCILNEKYLNDEVLNQILNSKLIYNNLPYLLSNFPDLIDKIPDDKLKDIDSEYWVMMISKEPKLFNKGKTIVEFNYYDLYNMLMNQPNLIYEFKKTYDVENDLNNEYSLFSFILKSKEDFNINFDKLSIDDLYKNINEFNIYNWLKILEYNHKLIKICPKINELNNSYDKYPNEVIKLVSKQISFKYLLPSVDKISNKNLSILISYQPQLIKELKIDIKKFNVDDWSNILKKQPQLINKCDKLKDIKADELSFILIEQPKLIKNCDNIYELTTYNWYDLLRKQPQLIKYCNKIDELSSYNWCNILIDQPKLADKCNKFDEFNNSHWYDLLRKQPRLIDKCKDINIMKIEEQINLLKKYPDLIDKLHLKYLNKIDDYCVEILYNSREHHIEYMKKYIDKDSKILTNMINLYPDLKEIYTEKDLWKYVDFNQLSNNLEYSILK